ncbi:unnamed protein product [Lactuca saligna]|uniref:Uncharacterized protein n=1 Tax=Lactuca saligna TaxID=75948 RepID=A0AA35ZEX6_LACSI|nr:unnamed protein product [Lactuca saligna]
MADDLRNVVAQASALMVAAANQELCDSEAEASSTFGAELYLACEKAALEDHVATLEGPTERLETQGVRKACEALGFEKGNQLASCSVISGEFETAYHVRVTRRTEEVHIAPSSFADTDFAGLFCLGELDYDSFRQFCHSSGPGAVPLFLICCKCFLIGWGFLSFPPPGPGMRELNFPFHALEVLVLSLLLDPVHAATMGSASP